jgi:hypothetical protein
METTLEGEREFPYEASVSRLSRLRCLQPKVKAVTIREAG